MKHFLLGILLGLLATTGVLKATAANVMVQPSQPYSGGLLITNSYYVGDMVAYPGANTDYGRFTYGVALGAGSAWHHRTLMMYCMGVDSSNCYGDTISVENDGYGLGNAAYFRADGAGPGPTITLKTAVRGDPDQWAVFAHQYALGPGTKVGLWIGGDSPWMRGLEADDVNHIIVVAGDVNPKQAVLQWNAITNSTGDFLRIFKNGKLVFEVDSNGNVRARSFTLIP